MDLIQILDMDWCKPELTEGIESIQSIVSTIILAIQIAIPVLLIIFGMLDLGKAVVASKAVSYTHLTLPTTSRV